MWRPLGFGEIFDRAITLYFRNFIAFAGLAIPYTIATIGMRVVLDGQVHQRGFFEQIVHPQVAPSAGPSATYWWSFFNALGSLGRNVGVPWAVPVFEELAGLMTATFVGVVLAVFYFDVRIRSEGLDLEHGVGELSLEVATGG